MVCRWDAVGWLLMGELQRVGELCTVARQTRQQAGQDAAGAGRCQLLNGGVEFVAFAQFWVPPSGPMPGMPLRIPFCPEKHPSLRRAPPEYAPSMHQRTTNSSWGGAPRCGRPHSTSPQHARTCRAAHGPGAAARHRLRARAQNPIHRHAIRHPLTYPQCARGALAMAGRGRGCVCCCLCAAVKRAQEVHAARSCAAVATLDQAQAGQG
jgi:hypothetical protein